MNFSSSDIRAIIDTITLEVSDRDTSDLGTRISDRTMDFIMDLRSEQPTLTDREIDRVAQVIVRGVLKRLLQIAESGGGVGTG